MRVAIAGISTGWWGTPWTRGERERISKVHFAFKGKPLCGARLAEDMEYQWCSDTMNFEYVDCERCQKKGRQLIEEAINKKC